jgi:hypothetical protein
MRYVSLINMIDQVFPSHGSLHPQLQVFCLCVCIITYDSCIANCIIYSPYLLLLAYEFPNYIVTQKNLVDHKLIYWHKIWLVPLIIFSLHNKSRLLMLFFYFCNRPTQFYFPFPITNHTDHTNYHSLAY